MYSAFGAARSIEEDVEIDRRVLLLDPRREVVEAEAMARTAKEEAARREEKLAEIGAAIEDADVDKREAAPAHLFAPTRSMKDCENVNTPRRKGNDVDAFLL